MKKLFVLVRQDLSKSQQAVQAAHAVAEHLCIYPEKWRNEVLVLLSVPTELQLRDWFG